MSGTRAGGLHARDTNIEKYGQNFYKVIGSIGGKVSVKKGFASNRELASTVGRIGGLKSRRTGVKDGQGKKALINTLQTIPPILIPVNYKASLTFPHTTVRPEVGVAKLSLWKRIVRGVTHA